MTSIPGSLGVPPDRPGRPPSLVPTALALLALSGFVAPASARQDAGPAAVADEAGVTDGPEAGVADDATDNATLAFAEEEGAPPTDDGADASAPADPAASDPPEDAIAGTDDPVGAFAAAPAEDADGEFPGSSQADRPRSVGPPAALGVALSDDDREALARVAVAEAGNQGEEGLAAVLFTVLNRVASGQFQGSVQAVVDAPNQFEPATRAGGWRGLPPLDEARRDQVEALLEAIAAGRLTDPTGGALYFQNARLVARRAAQGLASPELVDFGGTPPIAEIGDHRFYDARAGANLAALRRARDAEASRWHEEPVGTEWAGESEAAASGDVAATEEAAPFVLAGDDAEAGAD